MAKLDGLEVGVTVHRCDKCEYKRDFAYDARVNIDPEKDMLLLIAKMFCKQEHIQRVRDEILKQAPSGVVTVPCGFDLMIVPKDSEFWKDEKTDAK